MSRSRSFVRRRLGELISDGDRYANSRVFLEVVDGFLAENPDVSEAELTDFEVRLRNKIRVQAFNVRKEVAT